MKIGGSEAERTTLELSQRRWAGYLRRAWFSAVPDTSVLPRYEFRLRNAELIREILGIKY